jgi:FdhD protein
MPERGSTPFRFDVVCSNGADSEPIDRAVPIEAPIAIEYNGIGYAVMMATPADLDDFAIGFSLSEGLVASIRDVLSIEAHETARGVILRIQLPPEKAGPVIERARQRVSESSCGLCGLENLEQVTRPLLPVTARLDVPSSAIFRALAGIVDHQPLNAATGAAHAASFCDAQGTIVMAREDVGRHNALDKLLGALARAGTSPSSGFLLLTARCSFELVQKAVIANCPLLVTVSAATSLAVEQARAHGLALFSLARSDSYLSSQS